MPASEQDLRPDPDQLLQAIERQEEQARRGRLRVFFGAAPGVGKTFAMLSAARKLKGEGRDVVVGVVETHGRSETAELLQGLELLPRKVIEHQGRSLQEFDLDQALARRPALILVDEFAHSNAPGSRHPKRWQDVEELRAAGIDVFTTLNVQHLESLNDVVGGITGIRVHETVPDTVFDDATEVLLVDVPAEELLKRLAAGKVYLPDQAERAQRNFFRRGNLMALRELALRRTADRVEEDVQAYRDAQEISQVWKTDAALLVCVGPGAGSEQVVRSAARLAGEFGGKWEAVYVETPSLQRLPRPERERVLRCLKLAEDLGAQTNVLAAVDEGQLAQVIVEHARQHNFSRLVLGRPGGRVWPWQSGLAERISRQALEMDLIQVARDETTGRVIRTVAGIDEDAPSGFGPRRFAQYAWAGAACLAVAVGAMPLVGHIDLANIVMLFLLAVVLVAYRFGRGPSVFASIFAVLLFDVLFVPPRFSLAVSDVQYLITFAVMLVSGLVIGQLTANIRYQARIAAHRETRSRALYEFARDLSGVLQVEQVNSITTNTLEPVFRAQVALLLPDASGRVRSQHAASFPDLDSSIAQWAHDHGEEAGYATDTLPASPFRYLPLKGPMRVRGVLAIRPEDPRWLLVPEQNRQLATFAALIAIAIERIHYVEVAQEAVLNIESEQLRNNLLAAISHDLRTPLTALVGLADTLMLEGGDLSARQRETVDALRGEALKLSQQMENLLDMARLQAGRVRLRRDWQALEEVVGSALDGLKSLLGSRAVRVNIPLDFPLVEFDAVLIERVFANLVENACKYGQGDIEITAHVAQDRALVQVADAGPGLTSGMEEKIFEKFTRGNAETSTAGVGLGLAICRAIVRAHGGDISARNRAEGGAVFEFWLPLSAAPGEAELDKEPA